MKTWLPADTCRILRQGYTFEPEKCESRSLLLTRMPLSADQSEDTAAARRESLERALKRRAASAFAKSVAWLDRVQPWIRRLRLTLYADERLLLGLANGIQENAGLDLHPFFGVPVIAGSKLKGVAADSAQAFLRQGRLSKADMDAVFGAKGDRSTGSDGRAGSIDFLPAYPDKADCRLELDVLTVHYQHYYAGEAIDLDSDNPVPSLFPAVAEGQPFNFDLMCRTTRLDGAEAKRLLELAGDCLKHALLHHGVGAKTRAGYGRFRVEPNRSLPTAAADELFNPIPKTASLSEMEPTPSATLRSSQPTSAGGAVETFIAQWSGDTLIPEKIKRFADQLLKLPAADRVKAFDSCVPTGRRTAADPLWQAFRSRHHGQRLLAELHIS